MPGYPEKSIFRNTKSRQLVTTVFSGPSLPVDPRDISSEDSGRRSPRKKTEPSRGVEVSRVRKGCESSSCLCSCCCTLWCLRGPFVNDYGFLSPAPTLHPCKEKGRKRSAHNTNARTEGGRQDYDASSIKVET